MARLLQAEGAGLAEHVHIGQGALAAVGLPPGVQGGQHFGHHQVGEGLRVVFGFLRDSVCAQEGGHQLQPAFGVQFQKHLHLVQFRLGFQAVAGFGLGGGGAVAQQAVHACAGLVFEGFQAGLARGAHGGDDPAARRHDLQIGFALQPHFKFGGAVPGPYQMGVGVHKAGHHHLAARVQRRLIGEIGAQLGGGTHSGNFPAADQHRPVGDDPQPAEFAAALGAARQGDELRSGVNQHGSSQVKPDRKGWAVWRRAPGPAAEKRPG